MTFSENQVRHLYVANARVTTPVAASANVGTLSVGKDKTLENVWLSYKGAGGVVRSDMINVKNILSAHSTSASKMQHKYKKVLITLDADVNGGQPIPGQDYLLRVAFRQYIGMSDEDQYFKYGMVHGYSALNSSKFYVKLAESLVKNFSRELVPLVKFSLKTESSEVPVDATTKWDSLSDTYTGLYILEAEQEWTLGIKQQVPVYFDVFCDKVVIDGDEVHWGKVEEVDSALVVNNGHKIADLEYFCMGERGDMYRNIGWPHSIPTKYVVDPTKAYHVIDIHYAYVGSNEGPQKSEKTITIVCSDLTTTNNIISDLNAAIKASGITISNVA